MQSALASLKSENEQLCRRVETLQHEKDELQAQCEARKSLPPQPQYKVAGEIEEFAASWVKSRTGENRRSALNQQYTSSYSKEELERRLDKITEYCVELSKINRVLDLENRIAVSHLIKMQRAGQNVDLPARTIATPSAATAPARTQPRVFRPRPDSVKRRMK